MIERLKPMPLAFWRASSGREPVREWLQAMEKSDRSVIGVDLRAIQFGWPIGMPLAHDPEKWKPVFGKDHAQTKS
jgi:hypothetical protein